MTDDNLFKHHDYLQTVVDEDVRFLKIKDRSYGASWKLAGGRSAWFMLRRKMDRMIAMMARPEPPHGWSEENYQESIPSDSDTDQNVTVDSCIARYLLASHQAEDIFAKIAAGPNGEDGTLLAEVRDLRRYLLLVEAEMISQGAVEAPRKCNSGMEHPFGYPGGEG